MSYLVSGFWPLSCLKHLTIYLMEWALIPVIELIEGLNAYEVGRLEKWLSGSGCLLFL